jgi:hypothetical protein
MSFPRRARTRVRYLIRHAWRTVWLAWCHFWVERERPRPKALHGPACVRYTAATTPHPKHHEVIWVATDDPDAALAVIAGGTV